MLTITACTCSSFRGHNDMWWHISIRLDSEDYSRFVNSTCINHVHFCSYVASECVYVYTDWLSSTLIVDCYDSIVSKNDSHKSVVTVTVTPTSSLDSNDVTVQSSSPGLTAGIVILLVGIVTETVLCSAAWLVCRRRILKGSISSANGECI